MVALQRRAWPLEVDVAEFWAFVSLVTTVPFKENTFDGGTAYGIIQLDLFHSENDSKSVIFVISNESGEKPCHKTYFLFL